MDVTSEKTAATLVDGAKGNTSNERQGEAHVFNYDWEGIQWPETDILDLDRE